MYFIPIHQHKSFPYIQKNLQYLSSKKATPKQVLAIIQQFQNLTLHNKNITIYGGKNKMSQYETYSKPNYHHNQNDRIKSNYANDYNSKANYNQRSQSYNHHGKNTHHNQQRGGSKYLQLQNRYSRDLPDIFGDLAQFVLQLSNNSLKIPILTRQYTKPVSIPKAFAIYLLCLMALNLVPDQQYHTTGKADKFNRNRNFSFIFQQQQYKTQTIIEYFKLTFRNRTFNEQQLFLGRGVSSPDIDTVLNRNNQKHMSQYSIQSSRASIEDYYGCMKADFANKMIGGGALTKGLVQEEIMFANHPEMYISTLLCQSMKDNEAICFTGFKKYFNNDGYGYGAKFGGIDNKSLKQPNRQYIIAIDAIDFKDSQKSQYSKSKIDRQIVKAYAGFSMLNHVPTVATGNWGCGAFKGSPKLKFIIQWIACSLAGKQMIYCPFDKQRQFSRLNQKAYGQLRSLSPKQMYNLLLKTVSETARTKGDILDTMIKNCNGKREYKYQQKQKYPNQQKYNNHTTKTYKQQNFNPTRHNTAYKNTDRNYGNGLGRDYQKYNLKQQLKAKIISNDQYGSKYPLDKNKIHTGVNYGHYQHVNVERRDYPQNKFNRPATGDSKRGFSVENYYKSDHYNNYNRR